MKRITLVGMAVLFYTVAGALAQAGKDIQSTAVHQTKASQVDFAKELGCDSRCVTELGSKIDAARVDADPIELAVLANELAALEKATGKTADIKAADLESEAVALAKERRHSVELKTVAVILPDQATDLNSAADAAAKAEDAAKANKGGAAARGIGGTLHVDSRADEPFDIYVNGTYVGRVGPNGDGFMYVGQPYGTTTLFARGVFSGATVRQDVSEVSGDITWTLSE
jgi:hypothetical protein